MIFVIFVTLSFVCEIDWIYWKNNIRQTRVSYMAQSKRQQTNEKWGNKGVHQTYRQSGPLVLFAARCTRTWTFPYPILPVKQLWSQNAGS